MRLPDWRARLVTWATSRLGAPFVYGETDCALLAAEACDALTGGRLAEEYRGRWSTPAQALRFQRRKIDLPAALAKAGCLRAKEPALGDLAIAPKDGFWCGHVVFGDAVLSASPGLGVYLGRLSDVLAFPDHLLLRVP